MRKDSAAVYKILPALSISFLRSFQGAVISRYLFTHLKELNSSLWLIEDTKRKLEKEQNFDDDFIQYARLVYILNDHRARIKREIDNVWNSEIKEKKSHDGITSQ